MIFFVFITFLPLSELRLYEPQAGPLDLRPMPCASSATTLKQSAPPPPLSALCLLSTAFYPLVSLFYVLFPAYYIVLTVHFLLYFSFK